MNIFTICLICFIVILPRLPAEKETDMTPYVMKLNDIMDMAQPIIIDFIINNELDPMPIPDQVEGFKCKVVIVKCNGEVDLTNGVLYNLQSLNRSGDVILSSLDKVITISAEFQFNDMRFDYDYHAKIMNIGPSGKFHGFASDFQVSVKFSLDFKNKKIMLDSLHIHDVGKIKGELTGYGLFDVPSNVMIEIIAMVFKTIVIAVIEDRSKSAMTSFFDSINTSKGGFKRFMKESNLDFLEYLI